MATSDDITKHRSIIKYCVKCGLTSGQTIKNMILTKKFSTVGTNFITRGRRRVVWKKVKAIEEEAANDDWWTQDSDLPSRQSHCTRDSISRRRNCTSDVPGTFLSSIFTRLGATGFCIIFYAKEQSTICQTQALNVSGSNICLNSGFGGMRSMLNTQETT